MTVDEVIAGTPGWQQAIDRNLLPLSLALVILTLIIVFRQRKKAGIRLSPGEIQRNGILLALAFFCFSVLWLLGLQVVSAPPGQGLDEGIAGWARQHVSTPMLVLLSYLSEAGSTPWLTFVTFAIGIWQWRKGRAMIGFAAMAASGANGLAIRGLKAEFERLRPEHLHGAVAETGFSYPSGHAAGSILVYGILAWLITRNRPPRQRWPIFLLALAFAAMIAATRVLLQVHYLTDVVGGLMLGLGILALAIVWIRSREDRPSA